MDLEAYRRGEPEALAEVVDRVGPWIWALARRGFLCFDALTLGSERVLIRVLGAPTADAAAKLTEVVLSRALTPKARQAAGPAAAIELEILELARGELFRAAERAGRLVSVTEREARAAVPPEVEDLDALLESGNRPDPEVFTLDKRQVERARLGRAAVDPFLAQLDARSSELIRLRFVEGRTVEEVAATFDCGKAAVNAHEARLRRKARSRLRAALNDPRVGEAETDALLAERETKLAPPAPTWDRVRQGVLTRTFREEPAPFGRRLMWALAIATIGAVGWGLMFFGVIPSADDDLLLRPQVRLRCSPACLPGASVFVAVRAPRGVSRFAVALTRPNGQSEGLLTAPDGGTLRLPFGARARLLPAPHEVRLPSDLPPGSFAVAVFSDSPLTAGEVLDIAAGRRREMPGVRTATVSALR